MPYKLGMIEIQEKLTQLCNKKDGVLVSVEYKNSMDSNIIITCNKCTTDSNNPVTWTACYNNIIHHNSWCPYCSQKLSERKCREILRHLFPGYDFPTVRPKILKSISGRNLELDCYNEDLKLALEFNGIQHSKALSYFGGDDKLITQKDRDELKKKMCVDNAIKLIIVDCSEIKNDKWSNVKKRLSKECSTDINGGKYKQYLEPEESWLNDDHINVTENSQMIQKARLLEYLSIEAPGYKIKDTDTIIHHYRYKYILICPKGHDYLTNNDNFINGGRRCITCRGTMKFTKESLEAFVKELYPDITIDYKTYITTNKSMDFTCNVCNETHSRSLDNMKRSYKEGKDSHKCRSYMDINRYNVYKGYKNEIETLYPTVTVSDDDIDYNTDITRATKLSIICDLCDTKLKLSVASVINTQKKIDLYIHKCKAKNFPLIKERLYAKYTNIDIPDQEINDTGKLKVICTMCNISVERTIYNLLHQKKDITDIHECTSKKLTLIMEELSAKFSHCKLIEGQIYKNTKTPMIMYCNVCEKEFTQTIGNIRSNHNRKIAAHSECKKK